MEQKTMILEQTTGVPGQLVWDLNARLFLINCSTQINVGSSVTNSVMLLVGEGA